MKQRVRCYHAIWISYSMPIVTHNEVFTSIIRCHEILYAFFEDYIVRFDSGLHEL